MAPELWGISTVHRAKSITSPGASVERCCLVIHVPDFHHFPCTLRGFIPGKVQPGTCQLVRQHQIRAAKAVIPIALIAFQQKEEEWFHGKLLFKVSNNKLQGSPWVQGKREVGRRKVGSHPPLFVPVVKQKVQSSRVP